MNSSNAILAIYLKNNDAYRLYIGLYILAILVV